MECGRRLIYSLMLVSGKKWFKNRRGVVLICFDCFCTVTSAYLYLLKNDWPDFWCTLISLKPTSLGDIKISLWSVWRSVCLSATEDESLWAPYISYPLRYFDNNK